MRRLLAFLAAVACGLIGGAALPPVSPAAAHAVLLRTVPPANAVVDPPPRQVVLTFSEPVRPVPGQVRVIAPNGDQVPIGTPTATGKDLRLRFPADSARGTYLVSFRVVSIDGHPVSGSFLFSIGVPSKTPPTLPSSADSQTDPLTEADVDPVVRVAMPVARYLGYAGLALIAGLLLSWGPLGARRVAIREPKAPRPRRLLWCGVGAIVVGCVAELYLQAPHTAGSGITEVTGDDLVGVLSSRFGAAHLVRLVLVAAVVPLLAAVTSAHRPGRADHLVLAGLGVVGLVTWPLSGHPSASPIPPLSVVLNTAHLAAMAVWLGGLVMLARYLLPGAFRKDLATLLPVWSWWATVAVAVVAVTGLTQGVIEIGPLSAVVQTRYGLLLIAKVGLFATAIAAAWFARRYVGRFRDLARTRPASTESAETTDAADTGALPSSNHAGRLAVRLRRLVVTEVMVAAVVLAVTGVLVQTTPARTAVAGQAVAEQPYTTTLRGGQLLLQVDIDPARVGNNSLHLIVVTPEGARVTVSRWRATVGRPEAGVAPVAIPLVPVTDNHAVGEIALPTAGTWEFRFTVQTATNDATELSAEVPIR